MPFITKQYKFCAAHRYWNNYWTEAENFENFGDDIYLHGHNYNLDITISGEINSDSGFIVNLQKLNKIVQENGGKVILVPFVEGFSSTTIIDKIKNS